MPEPAPVSKDTPLIQPDITEYQLGLDEMDSTHGEFIDLVNRLQAASKTEFIPLFNELVVHTRSHFAREKELMDESEFPATAEHDAEHRRILGELERFAKKVNKGGVMFARAWIREQIPGWFRLHLATMDSALAAHLRKT